jgi:putative nucleotidyltransferase with HDIG domain
MNSAARVYVAAVSILAAGMLLNLPTPTPVVGPGQVLSIVAYIAIAILAEANAIDFRLGKGKQAKSSLAFLPFLSSIVIFEPAIAVGILSAVVAISQFLLRRNEFLRATFNVAMGVLSAALGSLAYNAFLSPGAPRGINLLGFVALAAVFFSTNVVLSSIAIALIRRQPIRDVLNQVAGVRGANLWYDLLASPIALVPATLYDQYGALGLIIIVLPLLLIRDSYLAKVQLEEANRDLLKVLVKAIETRDPYTSGHSLRVATLARAIADDLGLPRRQAERVETAALLHDIGKIDSVYEVVIRKPYDLNAAERELIRTHATKGADLLESLSSVNTDVIRAVRHHHERYDGSGYPSGLHGEEIPLAARIIMLCDSIDAMLSDRPYRKALSIEKTRLELIRCSGNQFDPTIVRVILQRNTLERAVTLVGMHNAAASLDEPRELVLSNTA